MFREGFRPQWNPEIRAQTLRAWVGNDPELARSYADATGGLVFRGVLADEVLRKGLRFRVGWRLLPAEQMLFLELVASVRADPADPTSVAFRDCDRHPFTEGCDARCEPYWISVCECCVTVFAGQRADRRRCDVCRDKPKPLVEIAPGRTTTYREVRDPVTGHVTGWTKVTYRMCARDGCEALTTRDRFCSARCRTAAWRERNASA